MFKKGRKLIVILFSLTLLTFWECSPGDNETDGGDADRINPDAPSGNCISMGFPDDDNDNISNAMEGNGAVDTDNDGKPDSKDEDSDNDGIYDFIEAGREECDREPVDSDNDGIPDYRDTDSDNNMIPDRFEINRTTDTDGDGIVDWCDPDDDNDGIPDYIEIGGDPTVPADSDGDGIPDYHDIDSDNDTILDKDEGFEDVDRDGLPNFKDTDSDNDGIPDIEEAGDNNPQTPPVDSDRESGVQPPDLLPDFIDLDSDDDGLEDWEEREFYHTDPRNADTDGDGITDLGEVVVGTDPLDANSLFSGYYEILCYDDPNDPNDDSECGPISRTLQFATAIQHADVYFMIDSTGSMSEEIGRITQSLRNVIVPGLQQAIPDVAIGVGEFRDECDDDYFPVRNRQDITTDMNLVQNALDHITDGGGCGYTTIVEGLYQVITGEGGQWTVSGGWCSGSYALVGSSCLEGGYGLPCFRAGSLPIIIGFSDAEARCDQCEQHYDCQFNPPLHTYAEVIATLTAAGARFIGVNSGDDWSSAGPDFRRIARDTGTVRDDGTPVVFDIPSDGSGIDQRIIDAVSDIAQFVRMEVIDCRTEERPFVNDGIDATRFIKNIIPREFINTSHPQDAVEGLGNEDSDPEPDLFLGVLPGTLLIFEIIFHNDFVPSQDLPKAYHAKIYVRGNRVTILDSKDVLIIVPGKRKIVNPW